MVDYSKTVDFWLFLVINLSSKNGNKLAIIVDKLWAGPVLGDADGKLKSNLEQPKGHYGM